MIPTQDDVRMALAATLSALSELPDDAWDAMAADLEWTCRETAAHIGDCLTCISLIERLCSEGLLNK
jgi:hypothetical protein